MAEVSDPGGALQVELHQLTLRYAHLRKRHPRQERALLSSLAEIDQQLPIVVVSEAERFVLIDGYKRVRALKRLARDSVRATCWQIAEVDALLLERSLRRGTEDALDQGWLLAELQERFQCSLEELARRFEHSKSWVSGRLALLQTLPAPIQEQVREGSLSAHAAMKYLVPLARTDAQAAQQLAAALTRLAPTTREVGALYAAWQSGTQRTRELIVHSPQIYLQAQAAQTAPPPSATQRFLQDLGALGGIARRAHRALQEGLLQQLLQSERLEVKEAFARANADLQRLIHRVELESGAC
jgi:ParB/RepB/Spo0J family partition protein